MSPSVNQREDTRDETQFMVLSVIVIDEEIFIYNHIPTSTLLTAIIKN